MRARPTPLLLLATALLLAAGPARRPAAAQDKPKEGNPFGGNADGSGGGGDAEPKPLTPE